MKKNLKAVFFSSEILILLVILVIAALLRFYNYSSFSYSNDELSAIMRLRYNTFAELVANGFYVDGHPGGIQVFLWYWVKLFGDSEASVRLPFVVAGVLSVLMVFKIGKFAFGSVSGLFASASLSFLQFPLLYSQIARPYGSGMLFSLLFIWFWLKVVFEENQEKKQLLINLTGFSISAALCMYNHYFSFLFALITGVSGLLFIPRQRLVKYILAAVFACILFLPHLYITLNHLKYKGVGFWLAKPTISFLKDHLFYVFDSSVYTLILIFSVVLILFFIRRRGYNHRTFRFQILFTVLFLMPILVGFIYSMLRAPVLQHSVLIFSFPCLLLVIFSFGGSELNRVRSAILWAFLGGGIIGTVWINNYYKKQHFGEFKDIAYLSSKFDRRFNKDVTIAISTNNPDYLKFYLKVNENIPDIEYLNINDTAGLHQLQKIVSKSPKNNFIFAWTKTCPPDYQEIIMSYFPDVLFTRKYGQHSQFSVYSKNSERQFSDHYRQLRSYNTPDRKDYSFVRYYADSVDEYSKGTDIVINDLKAGNDYRIEAEGLFKPLHPALHALMVISVEQNNKSIAWHGIPLWWYMTDKDSCLALNHIDFKYSGSGKVRIKSYYWNKEKERFRYGDIELKLKTNTLNSKNNDYVVSYGE